ncbi:hypothetical protein DVH24_002943 [Malus domestica]|uniref:FBD domain-containing protein n=1 Tax=Malus domestica TaxID=3750 RepID=A0A498KAK5_MALDO|nr:hypothetical protein DVH24_002943 [Malus domestica]
MKFGIITTFASCGDLPVFDNLNQLEPDFSDCDYSELLTKLLKSSPKLENLVIKQYSNAEDEEFDPPEAVPICLMSHLKITTVNEFRGRPHDKEVVTYLLKNGEVLNKMSVSTTKAFGDRQCAEENALWKEVLLFRRGSKTCQFRTANARNRQAETKNRTLPCNIVFKKLGKIHLSCGSFQSERLINPKIFRRLSNIDCLVNDGNPIAYGATVSFQYVAPNRSSKLRPIFDLLSNIHNLMPMELDCVNFSGWRYRIVTILRAYNLIGYVDGSLKCPDKFIVQDSTTGEVL